MNFCFCILVLYLAAVQVTVQKSSTESSAYVGAVVEYSPDVYEITELDVLSQNAKQFVNLIKNASMQDADIIVFPECGLETLHHSTTDSSVIPDPEDRINPCIDISSDVHEAIRILSCAARDNDIYVVVNIPEKKPCSQTSSSNCTTLHYNTDVVFDRQGVIIARYRKFNLFGEQGFNVTDTPDIATFTTDFGVKFGIFTCFDIIFQMPAVSLVKDYGITDIVFPTAWFSELPFLTAVQEQASWARGLNVNFLAAGYNNPSGGSTGSGIYAGQGGVLTSVMATEGTTKLLVARVPKMTMSSDNFPSKYPLTKAIESKGRILFKIEDMKPFTTRALDDGDTINTICHGSLCCTFTVKMKKTPGGYHYKLAVFDGVRHFASKPAGLQVCAVTFCANNSLESCGEEIYDPQAFSTTFQSISITGYFQLENATQLPNTLVQGYDVLSLGDYKFTRQEDARSNLVTIVMETTSQELNSLLTFGIYGRNFLIDGQPTISHNNYFSMSLMTICTCFGIAAVTYIQNARKQEI